MHITGRSREVKGYLRTEATVNISFGCHIRAHWRPPVNLAMTRQAFGLL